MKNATQYEKKLKKLLTEACKLQVDKPGKVDSLELLIRSVLESNVPRQRVDEAMDALREAFVDFNEVRVALPRELVEVIGKDFPYAKLKARMLSSVMQSVFIRRNEINLAYMEEMTKRDLRRHLEEIGFTPYAAALMVLVGFDGHAIPVDEDLRDLLEIKGYIYPGSDIPDVQGFLERVISQKNALQAHEYFRRWVEENAETLEKNREGEGEERKELAEQQAMGAAQARQNAEEQARAKLQAEDEARKAKARAKAAKKAAEKKAAAERSASKTTVTRKKSDLDSEKKADKKTATKTSNKTTRKKAKKQSAGKSKKTTAKAAKKTTKKATRKKSSKKASKQSSGKSRKKTKKTGKKTAGNKKTGKKSTRKTSRKKSAKKNKK
ncbi:MAG: hypothetical protein ACOCVI_01085 [Planctomycetota bacterium]